MVSSPYAVFAYIQANFRELINDIRNTLEKQFA